jgi:hypothetical protein
MCVPQVNGLVRGLGIAHELHCKGHVLNLYTCLEAFNAKSL